MTQLDIVLKKRPHGGSLQGVVTTAEGKPIAGAEVINEGGSSNEVRRAKTDSTGRFLLDDLYRNASDNRLVVKAAGFAPQRVEFKPGPAARPTEIAVKL